MALGPCNGCSHRDLGNDRCESSRDKNLVPKDVIFKRDTLTDSFATILELPDVADFKNIQNSGEIRYKLKLLIPDYLSEKVITEMASNQIV